MSTKEEFKIKIRSLYKSFANHKVLDGIDLDVKKGSSLVILGGSGSGKSVLIKNIVGLIKPDKGKIFIDNVEIQDISSKQKFEIMDGIGFLFQGGALFDSLNIRDNITFETKKLSKKEKNDLAGAKLNSVGLSPRILDLYPSELSGGMQKE
ncbi:MAG: putative ribonucleotide transport ATP-binding protein mkl [Rickettsia asembonensis]|nr:MAG: putative ribonucleotide transport ATP-binding protein mkl [Rickettsia asembonensis]